MSHFWWKMINDAFIGIMKDYISLPDSAYSPSYEDQPISVNEHSVPKKLVVSTSSAGGPENLPSWVLNEFSNILAKPVTHILISPLPKATTVYKFNKDLRPTLSKIAESFVIEKSLKPIMLSSIDPNQYGFIPDSSKTFALISMLHHCLSTTDKLDGL